MDSKGLNFKQLLDLSYKTKKEGDQYYKLHNYNLDRRLSTNSDRIYYNPTNKKVLMSFRGTKNLINDLPTDLSILTGNIKESDRYKTANLKYNKAKEKYNKDSIIMVGHSLGGSLASQIGTNNDIILTLNKGAGLFHKDLKRTQEQSIRHQNDLVSILSKKDIANKNIGDKKDNFFNSHSTKILNNKKPIFIK